MLKCILFSALCFNLQSVSSQTDQINEIIGGDDSFLSPKNYTIAATRIEGVDHLDGDAIRLVSGLTIGKEITVPGEDISKAISTLWEQNLFSNVEIGYDNIIGDEIFLYIKLTGLPKLGKYRFTDIRKGEQEKLRDILDLYRGRTITEQLVYNTKAIINEFYADKGFTKSEVEILQVRDTARFNVFDFTIRIDKGQRIKIKEINVFGNEITIDEDEVTQGNKLKTRLTYSDWGIRSTMRNTKRKGIFRIFSRSTFNPTAFENDKSAIIDKYNQLGYRDAAIAKDSVYEIDDQNLGVDLQIDKGERYYFGAVTWIGNTRYSSGFLDTILGIQFGDVYNSRLLNQRLYASPDGRDITSLYMDRGHLFFQLDLIETSVNENNQIDMEIRLLEGKEARIRNIIIKGNTVTKDEVILREIRTRPGDLFSRSDIIRTQKELANLGYFDPQQFGVNPILNREDGTVDIEYTVVERSSDQFEFSGTIVGGRLVGALGFTFNNFSTKNILKSWTPVPSGDGQILRIRAQSSGPGFQSYNFSFTEPWLGGKKPISLTIFANHSVFSSYEKEDPLYERIATTSLGIGLSSRLKWPDDYFQIYGEFNYQYYDLFNASNFVFNTGYANNISLKGVLSRTSVDSPIYPRSGSKLSLTLKGTLPYSLFNGIDDYSVLSEQKRYNFAEYYKVKFTGEWYTPLTNNRDLVLYAKFGFGFLGAYSSARGVSPFERFYLGGAGLNNSFQFDGREIIGLRGYSGDYSVSSQTGGSVIAKYALELRYPLMESPGATIYGLAFVEAGNTYNGFSQFDPFNVKRSAGFGIRAFLPMFGMIGVDFAWGFDPLLPDAYGYGTSSDPGASPNGRSFGFFPVLGVTLGGF